MELKKQKLQDYFSPRILFKQVSQDVSLQTLFLVNLATIFIAVQEKWGLGTLMWVYWFQSVIIGLFNIVRIIRLEKFTTEGFTMNNQPVPPVPASRYVVAGFFAMHYGLFHLVYFFFLLLGFGDIAGSSGPVAWSFVFGTSCIFFCNHLFSHIYNRGRDTQIVNIGTLMFLPYARILPMHLTIIFAPALAIFSAIPLIIFLLLKTFADMVTHIVEHTYLRKNSWSVNI